MASGRASGLNKIRSNNENMVQSHETNTGSNVARVTKVRAAALGTRGCSDKSVTGGQHNISSFRVASWNVDSMTGRAGELVKAFDRRKIDIVCVQETRWKGAGTRIFLESKDVNTSSFGKGVQMGQRELAYLWQKSGLNVFLKLVELVRGS